MPGLGIHDALSERGLHCPADVQAATSEVVDAIKNIGGTIGAMNEIPTMIVSTVEEQGSATQEIARNVQATASGTSQMSSSIIGVTRAAGQAGTAAGQGPRC